MPVSLETIWYQGHPLAACLAPAAWIFAGAARLRRALYRIRILSSVRVPAPVVVVGNIAVGGTGKTPLVVWAVDLLKRRGYRPGVVSRGYLGRARQWPQQVRPDSDPSMVGDEPVMLARRTGCPVAAGPDRAAAALELVRRSGCDVVVSDDGLQHLALARDVEIAVMDGERRLGNGRCLPAGPLREPPSRLRRVDFVVVNGPGLEGEIPMRLDAGAPVSVADSGRKRTLSTFHGGRIHAVCGVGNPRRFFRLLEAKGLEIVEHAYPDHHDFSRADIEFDDGLDVLMTEKDAVKCDRFAGARHWYLPVTAVLPDTFAAALVDRLGEFHHYG